jgi:N-acetylmuramoyl-L-alanine amidase
MIIRRLITILAIVAWAAAPAGAAGPKTKYERVQAQEEGLRLGRRPSPLSQIRKVAVAYEHVARQYPTSGYADNCLWQAAELSLAAFRIYQSDADRATAARLLQWLADEYPSSSLRPQALQALRKAKPAAAVAKARKGDVPPAAATAAAPAGAVAGVQSPAPSSSSATSAANLASMKILAENRAEEEAAARAAAERAAAEKAAIERRAAEKIAADRLAAERLAAERIAAEKLAADKVAADRLAAQKVETERAAALTRVTAVTAVPAAAPASSGAPRGVTLKDVTRTVIGDLVRVTLEFDGEVDYRQERIEGPARLFFDMKKIQTAPALQDAALSFNDTSVRNIRLGRPRPDTTRLVIDLDGVDSYSVFTLYNPYRVNVDLRRTTPAPATLVAKAKDSREDRFKAENDPVSIPTPVTPKTMGTVLASASSPPPPPPVLERIPPRPLPHPLANSRTPSVTTRAVSEIVDAPVPLLASAPSVVPVSLMARGALAFPRISSMSWLEPKRVVETKTGGTRTADLKTTDLKNADAKTPDTKSADAKGADTKATSAAGVVRLPSTTVAKATSMPPAVRQPTTLAKATTPPPLASRTTPTGPDVPAPAAPSANTTGAFSLARQLGLGVARIVIDPGHGGHDPGSLGAKVQEKDIVLDVALRLEKMLQAESGFDVVMTRRTDVFIPLEERTAIANRHHADLFLSIHTNSSRNKQASGIETYYLNFASNPEAEELAARENAGAAQTMNHLPEIVKAIALNNKLDESRDLAQMVQEAMAGGLKSGEHEVKDRGVKQAPLVVLIGAGMPSVLAEISFITHANEGNLMKTAAYRQKVAESLFAAVKKYQRSLKSVGTVASQVTLDDDR